MNHIRMNNESDRTLMNRYRNFNMHYLKYSHGTIAHAQEKVGNIESATSSSP